MAALPTPPSGMQGWFQSPDEFTFEWLNQGQMIYAFVTVPAEQVQYLTSQITAAYPEALVQPLEHEPLQEFEKDLPKAWTEITFNAPSYLPIRTYKDFPDTDPLSTVLSALSKLKDEELALIQLRVHKVNESAKSAGYSAQNVKQTKGEGSEVQEVSVPHPQKEHMSRKLQESWFAVSLHIMTQAPTKEQAKTLLDSLSNTFNVLQSEANSLKAAKPWVFRRGGRPQQIENRSVKIPKQYFSTSELATLFHLPNKKLAAIRNIAWGKNLLGEPPENLPIYENFSKEELDNVNLFGKTEFKNQAQIFGIKREDRRRHMYAIGKSGTGKSTLLANMIINDLKHGEGLAVVDPHGDLIDTVLNYIPKSRINDVIVLDPADPEAVVQINLFEAGSSVHRELVASGIIGIFQKMYGYSWGPRLEYILRNTLLTLLHHEAKLEDILRILNDKKYRDEIAEKTDDKVLRNFWFYEFNRLNEKQRTEAVSPIMNKVGQFVTSPLIRAVVNTRKSSIDIEQIMNEGKILLVNVSQGRLGEDNAALLGAMIITKIQLAAMNRVYLDEEKRRDFYLYIDEFQNFATTSFVKILSEARKYRLNLILANQYIDQIPEEVRTAIFGNAGNMVSFILGASDADHLQKEFGNKYSAEDLVSLGRYQIITRLLIDGHVSQPFPAHTLNLASSRNQNREKVLRVSRERYARKRE
ncbi:type IV secretion system DNA-binding domain-containing protein [Candidatus Woesebacteria bacterium]|nr:type IV secretion system DNA-binding domain-containing protein [Candidatus Woesebacteria bacterium]